MLNMLPRKKRKLRLKKTIVILRLKNVVPSFDSHVNKAKIISLLLSFIGFSLACRALQDNVVQYFSQNVINGKWLDISELRLHSNNSQSRARALAPFHKLPEPSSSYSSITRYCRAEPELSWLVSTGSSWSRIRAACPTLHRITKYKSSGVKILNFGKCIFLNDCFRVMFFYPYDFWF